STDDDPQPRGGLDTRSLALAARPPEGEEGSTPARWRSLRDHRRARWSRHPLAGARCSTTGRRGGLDTRSLALAARPPEGEEVSTLALWRSLLDHRKARSFRHPRAARPPEGCSRAHGTHLRLEPQAHQLV